LISLPLLGCCRFKPSRVSPLTLLGPLFPASTVSRPWSNLPPPDAWCSHVFREKAERETWRSGLTTRTAA
jgi:hypothetical protein